MRISPQAVEHRRRVLEQEHGGKFLTVKEAARELGINQDAIYQNPSRYPPVRYESSVFIAADRIEELLAARTHREVTEIRGVEHEDGVGRMDVMRFLCLPCRRYFRTRGGFDSHECAGG